MLLNLLIKTKLCRMRLEKTSVISAGWLTVIAPPPPFPQAACPLFPVQVLSICLCGSNVQATALLIGKPPYKVGAESAKPYQPFPFIYTDCGCTRARKNPPVYQTFFASSRNIFIVIHRYVAQLALCRLTSFFSCQKMRFTQSYVKPLNGLCKDFMFSCPSIKKSL